MTLLQSKFQIRRSPKKRSANYEMARDMWTHREKIGLTRTDGDPGHDPSCDDEDRNRRNWDFLHDSLFSGTYIITIVGKHP
jgi:hypothetical protein